MKLTSIAPPPFYKSKLDSAPQLNQNNLTDSISQNSQKSNFGMYDRGLLYGISFRGIPSNYDDYNLPEPIKHMLNNNNCMIKSKEADEILKILAQKDEQGRYVNIPYADSEKKLECLKSLMFAVLSHKDATAEYFKTIIKSFNENIDKISALYNLRSSIKELYSQESSYPDDVRQLIPEEYRQEFLQGTPISPEKPSDQSLSKKAMSHYSFNVEYIPQKMHERLDEEFNLGWHFSSDLSDYIYSEIKDRLKKNGDEIPNTDEVLKRIKEKCDMDPNSWVAYTTPAFDPKYSTDDRFDRCTRDERLGIISSAINKDFEQYFEIDKLKEELNGLFEHLMKDHNEDPSFEFSSDEISRFRKIIMANLKDSYREKLNDVLRNAIETRRKEKLEEIETEIAKRKMEEPELSDSFDSNCKTLSNPLSDDEFEYFKEAIFTSFHRASSDPYNPVRSIIKYYYAQENSILNQEPSERLKSVASLIFREDEDNNDIKFYEETLYNYLEARYPNLPLSDDKIKNLFNPVYQKCKKGVDDKIKEINEMTAPIVKLVKEATDDELKDKNALFEKIKEQYTPELEKYMPQHVMKNHIPGLAATIMINRMLADETKYQKIKEMIEDFNSEYYEMGEGELKGNKKTEALNSIMDAIYSKINTITGVRIFNKF